MLLLAEHIVNDFLVYSIQITYSCHVGYSKYGTNWIHHETITCGVHEAERWSSAPLRCSVSIPYVSCIDKDIFIFSIITNRKRLL